jgi:hypothetical protein
MKIEFELKDCDGVDLQEGDRVEWVCQKMEIKPTMFGIVYDMWNSGQIINGRVTFDPQKLHVVFASDDGEITWYIQDLPDNNRHDRMRKI